MSVPLTAKAVTGAFVVSGVIHLVKPEVFEPLVPEQLPGTRRQWVLWSGVAELDVGPGTQHLGRPLHDAPRPDPRLVVELGGEQLQHLGQGQPLPVQAAERVVGPADVVQLEPGFAADLEALRKLGHDLRPLDQTWGNLQVVTWDPHARQLRAASDPRGVGAASVQLTASPAGR